MTHLAFYLFICLLILLLQVHPLQSYMRLNAHTAFFNAVVDCSILSVEDRFKSLSEVKENFGVLFNFRELDQKVWREQCEILGEKLSCGEEADIDGSALAVERENLPELPQTMMTAFELLTYLLLNETCERSSQDSLHSACDSCR